MADQKVKLAFDLSTGDRSAVGDFKSIKDLSEALSDNFEALDRSTQRMVLHMEQMARQQMRGGPMQKTELQSQERRVKYLKDEAEVTRRLSQVQTDSHTRERMNKRATALEAAHGMFGGIGGASAMGGAAGSPRGGGGGLRGFLNSTPGANFHANHPLAMQLLGISEPRGTVAERIGSTVTGARHAIGGAITTGVGLAGLFEGLNLVSSAMGEYEQRAKGIMRVSSMLGVSTGTLTGRVDNLRSAWGFLSEEGLTATMSMAGTMGVRGTGRIMGAGMLARAYGLDIGETAGRLGTFERYTRGGGMGLGGIAGRLGLGMEPDVVAEFKRSSGGSMSGKAAGVLAEFLHGEGPVELTAKAKLKLDTNAKLRAMTPEAAAAAGLSDARYRAIAAAEGALGPVGARAYLHGTHDEATAAFSKDPAFVTGAAGIRRKSKITRLGGTRSDSKSPLAGAAIGADRYESILEGAFGRSGLKSHLAGEFLESSAGLARTFAGRGGIADPSIVTGLLGLMGGAAWGTPGTGFEPGRAADTLGRFAGGITGEGDSLAYAMKVRALGRLSGPVTIKTPFGDQSLDPKNPLHLKLIMENAMQSKEVLGAYMAEAKSFGGLGTRALVRMTGGALSETEALGMTTGSFDVDSYFKRTPGASAFGAARAAMETEGGTLVRGGASIEKNMEDLGKELATLRHEIRVAITTIAGAATGEGGGLVPALKAVAHAIGEFPTLMGVIAAGQLLQGNVGAAVVIGGASFLGAAAD